MAWKAGVGNIANYTEGRLRQKVQLYANEGVFDDISIDDLTATGAISAAHLSSSGGLSVDGAAQLSNNLSVSGTIATIGLISGSNFIATELAQFAGAIKCSGSINTKTHLSAAAGLNIDGAGFFSNNLSVSGTLTTGVYSPSSLTTGHLSSSACLSVDGDAQFSRNLALSGSAAFAGASIDTDFGLVLPNSATTGRVKAYALVTYSSKKLKTNIKNIQSPVEKIMALRGVTYNWENSGVQDIGMIAEEVQKVFPEVVHDSNDYMGLDYPRLTSVLVEAVKEQQRELKKQKKIIMQLKENIDNLLSDD